MNENGTKRREWVKTAAIIFLSVLLVLTFFSNTIMNYSLPEVAAQYVQSGSITAKIRGTGMVESGDLYQVEVTSIRTIESVKVREGDSVTKDDVLFVLADEEDEMLQEAKENLKSTVKEYEDAIRKLEQAYLTGAISEEVYKKIENGTMTSFDEYRKRMQNIDAQIEALTKQEVDLTAAQNNLQYYTPDTSAEEKAHKIAEDKYNELDNQLNQKKVELSEVEAELKSAQDYLLDVANGFITVSGNDATEEYNIANKKVAILPAQIESLKSEVKVLNEETYAAEVEMNKKQTVLDNKKGNTANANSIKIQLYDVQNKKKDAEAEKDKLIKSISDEYGETYDLNTPYEAVLDAREVVNKLEAKSIGATVDAPITGTIISIERIAGQKTGDGVVLATIQPEGQGYTMSFSVTNEQAKRLSVGDKADLVNAWRYDDVDVSLKSIKPDKTEPGQKKLLTFDVKGDVIAGQTLNVSVGQKSADYDLIVPNSAIREDNNGKFILIVETKSSPLGNRFVATRVDVQVVASDDTKSAITGALYGYEFVITTSTQPVEAGQLVRMAEN